MKNLNPWLVALVFGLVLLVPAMASANGGGSAPWAGPFEQAISWVTDSTGMFVLAAVIIILIGGLASRNLGGAVAGIAGVIIVGSILVAAPDVTAQLFGSGLSV